MKAVYGTFDATALRAHLEKKLPDDWDVLFVHSSVNNMAPMFTGSPLDLVKMLVEFVGPERTLAMPAFFFGDPKIGGARATFEANPRFDVRRTPSQMGLATEMFRRWKGVVTSRHPVYRIAALGPGAAALTAGHELADTACGRGTPFDQLANGRARILGIGKPFEVLTQVHHAEDLLGDDFPVPSTVGEPLPMTIVDGPEEIPFRLRGRGFAWRRDMWRLRKIMPKDELREWSFHRVPLFTCSAKQVTDRILAAAERGLTIYEES